MTYRGHVANGVIQVHGPAVLPEGAEVAHMAPRRKKKSIPASPRSKRNCEPFGQTFLRMSGTGCRRTSPSISITTSMGRPSNA